MSNAWHRDECPSASASGNPSSFRELFWYGSEDVTQAVVIVVLYSRSSTTGEWTAELADYAETYLLDDFYGDCISLDIGPLRNPTPPP
jgi:hypothetical protein